MLVGARPRLGSRVAIREHEGNGARGCGQKRSAQYARDEAVRRHLPDFLQPLVTLMYLTGWRISEVTGLEWRQIDMRAGSEFLRHLNDADEAAGYEVFPYVRLGDMIVGTPNAAPPGRDPWWVPAEPLQDADHDIGARP